MKIAIESPDELTDSDLDKIVEVWNRKKQKSFGLINDSISCITCVIVYSPLQTLISILLIYSVTDALNVYMYMYVMYLVLETFHMQELYPTTLYRLHSSELSRGPRLCQRGANAPPPPPHTK